MDDALKKELLSSWWAWRNGNHVEFWQREYDKHGKCSDNVFPKTEYFRKTLAVYHDFDIAQTLQKANIAPQPLQPKMSLYKLYSIDQITKAIKSETGRRTFRRYQMLSTKPEEQHERK
ncbi:ribonuclease T2-like [Malus domestica]|uniref:ribonuclease T2-like n=1 Tax=Malus domestica TaxID=3750 RepID=UPI003974CCA5